jgi:hypothetical protein
MMQMRKTPAVRNHDGGGDSFLFGLAGWVVVQWVGIMCDTCYRRWLICVQPSRWLSPALGAMNRDEPLTDTPKSISPDH